MYTETGKKLPQNYDISLTCDLMEFPLRALACKIYFLLEAWRSRWPPPPLCARQITKKSKFLQLKSLFYSDNNI